MSTTEEPEATTDAVDVAADLLPTGTVEQAVLVADEVPEGGLTTDAAADLLPTGDAPSESDVPSESEAPAADESVVEVLDEDDLFDGDGDGNGNGEPAPIRESAYDRPGGWYVVHTQSGYEKKVKQNLQARTTSMHLEDRILEVEIPMEDVDEFRNGKKVTVSKKVFPGYLLVRCHLDDEAWSVIRDTPGIVNFVGAGGKPSKLARVRSRPSSRWPTSPRPWCPSGLRPASGSVWVRRFGSRRDRSRTSPAPSWRSMRTSSRSRCWSTSSGVRPRSNWSSPRLPSFRGDQHDGRPRLPIVERRTRLDRSPDRPRWSMTETRRPGPT